MTAATTYIVIEVSEKENALDIMNILMTHTKARFTITKDIREYAAERDKLGGTSSTIEQKNEIPESTTKEPEAKRPAAPAPVTAPVTIREDSPDIEEIDPSTYYGFGKVVPKNENLDDHPPEPYRQMNPHYQQIQEKPGNFSTMFHAPQQNPMMMPQYDPYQGLPPLQHNIPSTNNYPPWQEPIESTPKKKTPPLVCRKRGRPSAPMSKRDPTGKSSEFSCAMCGSVIKAIGLDFAKRKNHAIIHLDFKRYACPIDACDYASRHRSNITSHVRLHHKKDGVIHVSDQLTDAQNDELRAMVYRCFPEMSGGALPGNKGDGDNDEDDDDAEGIEYE